MSVLELTRDSTGWSELISRHLAAGHRVTVNFDMPGLSPNEFADQVGLSRTAVMKWIERGKIRAELDGSYWKIPPEEVPRFRDWYADEIVRVQISDAARDLFEND